MWLTFIGFFLLLVLYILLGEWEKLVNPAKILTCQGPMAQQSPIDFGDEVVYNPHLDPSKFAWLNWTQSDIKEMEIPGFRRDSHGWEINFIKKPRSCWALRGFQEKSKISDMTASHLVGLFRPDNIHMHWQYFNDSTARGVGSEHSINNTHFPAELHIVFFNERFGTFEKALGKRDGVAVVGIFVTVGLTPNEEYTKIGNLIRSAGQNGGKVEENDPRLAINPWRLIPGKRDFFAYTGSKTTPGYQTCVQWIVFKDPIVISQQDYEDLFNLEFDLKNARNIQPVAGPVYSSFIS